MRRRPILALPMLVPWRAGAQAPVTIFAAASLTEALRELAARWAALGHPAPRMTFAASSALARQIEQGAPADIFASADERWADYLQARHMLANETRRSAIGNTLVLIGTADAAPPSMEARALEPLALEAGTDLLARLGPRGRIAMGDPAHVPAGRYAQAALTWMGQWDALSSRLARAENVRAALLLVVRGEAPLGIVYATDVMAGVRLLGTFPAASHPPISYPFALTRRAAGHPEARALLDFLTGPEALPHWRRLGFIPAR